MHISCLRNPPWGSWKRAFAWRSRRVAFRWKPGLFGLSLFLVALGTVPSPVSAVDLEEGDLLVGAGVSHAFGETSGVVVRIRDGSAVPFCQSPTSGLDPDFWNVPQEVLVDSEGRVVFLAWMGSFFFGFQDWGLFRCDRLGATPELLAFFPSVSGTGDEGHPLPFPGESFETVSGLHLAKQTSVVIDDDVDGGAPRLGSGDTYVFAVGTWDPNYPPQRLDVRTVRYLPEHRVWEEGPRPITQNGVSVSLPDMVQHAGDTYAVVHPDRLLDGRGVSDIIRRIAEPLRLEASGEAGGLEFRVELVLFGGARDIGGGVGEGSFAEIAATGFVLDDLTVPNPSVCMSNGPVSSAVPYNSGGSYNVPAGFGQIVFDDRFGLVVTSNSGAAGTPYLTSIDLAGLNDDPNDDISQYFLRPELGCLPQRSIKFEPILPFFDPDGSGGNGATQLVSATTGLFGTQSHDGEVVKIAPGTKVETVAGGLVFPSGIAAYPPNVKASSDLVVILRIDSPVNVLVSDSLGRRLGVDPDHGSVNDFGALGFDSGPGEPRFYAIRKPAAGTYSVQAWGTADGPFTIHVYSAGLSESAGRRLSTSGFASVGSLHAHELALEPEGSVVWVPEASGSLGVAASALWLLELARRRARRIRYPDDRC